MPNKHKTKLLGWHPPAEVAAWVRERAKLEGVEISNVLTRAVYALRNDIAAMEARRAQQDKGEQQ